MMKIENTQKMLEFIPTYFSESQNISRTVQSCSVQYGKHQPHGAREHLKDVQSKDFPGSPVVENLPFNAGDAGLISGRATKIPHAMPVRTATTEPHDTTREPPLHNEDPACCN